MKDDSQKSQYVNAATIGDLFGVNSSTIRRWARDGQIPKVILPSGRFVFNPKAVLLALKKRGVNHANC
ncbi:MAG TPA: excisionase [Phycisphaerales bacterium]|nr:excisionase [Phycisphaerales bacterium]